MALAPRLSTEAPLPSPALPTGAGLSPDSPAPHACLCGLAPVSHCPDYCHTLVVVRLGCFSKSLELSWVLFTSPDREEDFSRKHPVSRSELFTWSDGFE